MKKIVLLFTCMFSIVLAFAQTNFQNLFLDKALEKAKADGKYVFVDCYTSWCGPCKVMAEKVLPLKEVGEYMNSHFVCIKIDMEKGEGPKLAQRYSVSAFPTFLILKTDGTVMHRLVGAILDGREFIEKINVAFDENSATNLEKEYVAGNRNMDFLVKYVKSLLVLRDIDKARNVAQEIIVSLDDEEKCSEPYWFIYEDMNLSPVGSGNMNYLLKHVEQFRHNVGVEKVDKKVASLFETQLEDIIRGRNKNIREEDLNAAKAMLDTYKLSGQDYLYDYIDLIKALSARDTDKVLAACKAVFPKLADEKIAYLYFMPITSLKDNWSKEQVKELITLTNQLIERAEMSQLKISLGSFKTGVLEKM